MNNIFENAYFGKPYKTRDEKKALYQCGDDEYHHLFLPSCDIIVDNCGYINCKELPSGLDIVSEWQELTTKEEMIDEACEIFADIINEVIPINASDMPYIKKFRKAMEDKQ